MPARHRPALLLLSLGCALSEPAAGLQARAAAAPPLLSIDAVQGAGHRSPHAGERVITVGVVTAVDSNGFYLEGGDPDGDPATSSGLFVFTGERPAVRVGDLLELEGTASEFLPGGPAGEGLSVTELVDPVLRGLLAEASRLPEPTVLGAGGRPPPVARVDDDGLAHFDPDADGIDFYESLEGMRVRLTDPRVVGPSGAFRELWVVVDGGRSATGLSARGALVAREGDANPERVQVQPDADLLPGAAPAAEVGDRLGDVVGVVGYGFGSFEVRPTEPWSVEPAGLGPETAAPGDRAALRVASFNVENLDPGDGGRVEELGAWIAERLRAPDLVALQEVQDGDGPLDSGEVGGTATWTALVEAIEAAGGPRYAFVELPPEDGADGGEPGGNIRVGYLYDPGRLSLVPRSLERWLDLDPSDGDAFAASRKPLAAEFVFEGTRCLVVNLHWTARGGGSPAFGALQPPRVGGLERRTAQAAEVRARLDARLGAEPGLCAVVLGDLNEVPGAAPLLRLAGEGAARLVDLAARLPEAERYSHLFEGEARLLDHVLVPPALARGASFDVVHGNAELRSGASDHDPVLAHLPVPEPAGGAPLALGAAGLASSLRARARGRARPPRSPRPATSRSA
jgi:hypothetical protein